MDASTEALRCNIALLKTQLAKFTDFDSSKTSLETVLKKALTYFTAEVPEDEPPSMKAF